MIKIEKERGDIYLWKPGGQSKARTRYVKRDTEPEATLWMTEPWARWNGAIVRFNDRPGKGTTEMLKRASAVKDDLDAIGAAQNTSEHYLKA